MQRTLIFSFIAIDKVGIIEQLAHAVAANDGNWLQSRMTQLSGKFAGIVQVSVAQAQSLALQNALLAMACDTLAIMVEPAADVLPQAQGNTVHFDIIGLDRVGIVKEVTTALAQQQLNVIDMHSQIEHAPMSAEHLFKADIRLQMPANTDYEALHDTLDSLCQRLDLDWNLSEV